MSKSKFTITTVDPVIIFPYENEDEFIDGYYYSGTLTKCKLEALKVLEEIFQKNKDHILNLTEKSFK